MSDQDITIYELYKIEYRGGPWDGRPFCIPDGGSSRIVSVHSSEGYYLAEVRAGKLGAYWHQGPLP